jgi:hypothetical protein
MSTELPCGVVPPGAYANGARSPIVHVLLCPPCAGFAPMTSPGYFGFLSGACQGCGDVFRELHRFPARIDSASGCSCTRDHKRVVGDLTGSAECEHGHYVTFFDDAFAVEHFRPSCHRATEDVSCASCAYQEAVERVVGHGAPIDGRWRIAGIDSEGLPILQRAEDLVTAKAGA